MCLGIIYNTRVPSRDVLVFVGYVPGYQTRAYTLGYPGIKLECFGHTRVCTRLPQSIFTGYPGIRPGYFGHPRLCTNVPPNCILWGSRVSDLDVSLIIRCVPGYQTRVYNLGCPGIKPGCFGHTRLCTWVPQSIFSCLPGYQIWMLRTYSGMYPGTHRLYTLGSPRIRPGCFGHYHVCTRVSNQSICCDRVSNLRCFGHTRICTRVHTLGVPGYQTCMFRSYSGMLVEHVIWAKESLTFRTREQVHFFTGIMLLMGCLLYTSPSPRDRQKSRMPSSA